MDVPITKPSMVSYADDLDFAQLLKNLFKDKHNGFMRITVDEYEGFIIFKDGLQVAAEYHKFSKSKALENIMAAVKNEGTLVEVFDLRASHIDYIMDVNKQFLMETDYNASKIIAELKGVEEPEPPVSEDVSVQSDSPVKSEIDEVEKPVPEPIPKPEPETIVPEPETKLEVDVLEEEPAPQSESVFEPEKEPEIEVSEVEPHPEIEVAPEVEETAPERPVSRRIEPDREPEKPMDRSKLLAKYGIKEMNEDDVDMLLDTYKGGSLNDEDVEKIELTLMNKIKKSIFGIPKIKGTEVMVFLENNKELRGDVNIMIEYGAKGFLSRFMGESQDIENLRRQVINIVQIEIKKSFRKYPQMVDNFYINVEIS